MILKRKTQKQAKEQVLMRQTTFPALAGGRAGRAGRRVLALSAVLAVLLSGCEDGSGAGSNSFRNNYTNARTALESGQYDKANRIYVRMLQDTGPLQPRIQLEYAHSLLRSGAYGEAIQQAQSLSQSQSGTARSAALSVLGAAHHELGLTALTNQDAATGRQHLVAAQNAIAEVLGSNPELDPLGALAGRQASIKVQLKSLG